MKSGLTRQERRKAWLYAVGIVAVMLALAALALWLTLGVRREEETFLPPESDALLTAARGLDEISVNAVFDPEGGTLTARQVMTLVNRSGQTLQEITLRSWSGAYLQEDTSPAATEELFDACYGEEFSPGGLTLGNAQVNRVAVTWVWTDEACTVLTLPVKDWQAEESVTVTLDYTVAIPACRSRFGVSDGIWQLGNVFPTAAVWLDGTLRTDEYVSVGYPFLSECANWTVRLTVPEGYTAASTGSPGGTEARDGQISCTFTAGAVRDFALVISDRWQTVSLMAEDVLVTAHARDRAVARRMTECARQAIACYEEHYGPYAYPTLTLCEADFPWDGACYPRLGMIGVAVTGSGDALEEAVARETARQWWGMTVGSDGWYQPWQSEALCEYALLDYVGRTQGEAARESRVFERIETAMRITILEGITPGSPLDYFADRSEYSVVTRQRGAALLLALENYLGKEKLDGFLEAYQGTYRFRIATRRDMEELLARVAGQDLSALFLDYLDTEISN